MSNFILLLRFISPSQNPCDRHLKHVYGTETIAVVGPALLRFKEGDDIYDFEIPPKQVYKFVIPPKVAHAIKNTGVKDNILVAFNTVAHNSKKPDVISKILMNH